ncbi:MAG: trigger factor [Candidatus Melainabacteria bacterium]|nr:trigger factor [Candidatus Melainabacteria bacterium]
MKVAVEKQEKNVAVINLEIEADHAQQEYNKACRRIGQRVNIPGFRRGKAPRAMIEKTVGQDRIKQEALERLLPHAFADAISEHQLDVVAPPQVETFQFDLQSGIQVKAQVELRPEVTLPDLSLAVDVVPFTQPEGSQEAELKKLVERLTSLETVIDRAAEATDIVNIDFSGSVDGEAIRGGSAKNYRLDLMNNNFIDGFAAQVVGHKLGEEFTIELTFPSDYHDATLAAKPASFVIKINEIMRRVVPELSDELAKKLGNYENLDALKAEISSGLQRNEDAENEFRKQKAVIEAVVNQSSVDIPASMINRESRILMEDLHQRFKGQGLSWEEFMDAQGQDTVWENLRSEAQNRIKTSLVFGAIAKRESIAITEEEFSAQVRELAQVRGTEEKNIMRQLANNPGAIQALTDQVLAQKVVEFLVSKSTFRYVEASTQGEGTTLSTEATAIAASSLKDEEFEVLEVE